ncbi:MAG: hypothetical protein ABI402_09055 [Ferruginibacter sp.]
MENEFYIGWLPNAPKGFSKHVKKVLLILLPIVILFGVTLALLQKKFDTGNFEFGTLTEVKGIYFNKPVPLIKVINGKDIWGNLSYITIPLVGYGKYGADGIIADIEKEKNISLDEKEITLKGTLLYNDGKTIMQVSANDKPLISFANIKAATTLLPLQKELGERKVKGEIIDPKCFFGVMKPGEGKVHRDCAIRCILGGIPPVMLVRNSKGDKNYYLVVGPNGEKMNEAVHDYVAEPVEMDARLVQYDDWIIMYVKDKQPINRISGLALLKDEGGIFCCRDGNRENGIANK